MESGETEKELHGDLTENQVLDELAKYWVLYPERQPGDLDIEQICERFKCCRETVRVKMNDLIKKSIYKKETVSDNGKRIFVYRRVK